MVLGVALVLGGLAASPASAKSGAQAREALARGLEAHEEGAHETAAEAFAEAANLARGTKLDPAVARFNEANVRLAGDDQEAAAEAYTEAFRTTDLGLQRDAYFNRGNALMGRAAGLETGAAAQPAPQQPGAMSGSPPPQAAPPSLQPAIDLVNEATSMYEQAMRLDPDDVDAKVNFELALKKLEELEIKQQQQQEQQQQDQQNQDQQQQDQQQQDQQDQQQQDQQDQQQDPQDQQQQQDQQQDQQQGQQEQPSPDDPPQQDPQPGEQEPEPMPTEEMTREEAEMLLDAKREEEKAARERVRLRLGPRQNVEKDW